MSSVVDEGAIRSPLLRALTPDQERPRPKRSAMRRYARLRLALAGLVMIAILGLLALFAPVVAQHGPSDVDLRARDQGPSVDHWLGTDRTGRDTFARTVYAGRVSLSVGIAAVVISVTIGAFLGAIAGYFGGFVDDLVMRFTDVVMTFPPILIILLLAALTGPGLWKTILLIGLLNWPIPCRLVRAKFLALRNQEFVLAARAMGCSPVRIIGRHAFPSVTDVLVVYASLGVAAAILLEAGLSFLGLGVQPPTASWGNMLNVARNVSVLEHRPWQWMPAGGAIVIIVLAINLCGDGLRDTLDPRMRL